MGVFRLFMPHVICNIRARPRGCYAARMKRLLDFLKREYGTVTLVVLVAAAGGYLAWPKLARTLARLHPGPTLVFAVDADHPWDNIPPDEARRRTLDILRGRIRAVAPNAIVRAEGDRLALELTRDDAAERVTSMLTRSGRLEFLIVDDGSDYMRQVVEHAPNGVTVGTDNWTEHDGSTAHSDRYLRAATPERLGKAWHTVLADAPLPADHSLVFERRHDDDGNDLWRSYYVFSRAEVTGDCITGAEVQYDPQTGRPEVSLTFDAAGARAFEALTARSVGRKLAIVLEGVVSSAPVIESRIGGGHARITMGGFGDPDKIDRDAKDLVAVLRVGALPAPVTLVETRAPR